MPDEHLTTQRKYNTAFFYMFFLAEIHWDQQHMYNGIKKKKF